MRGAVKTALYLATAVFLGIAISTMLPSVPMVGLAWLGPPAMPASRLAGGLGVAFALGGLSTALGLVIVMMSNRLRRHPSSSEVAASFYLCLGCFAFGAVALAWYLVSLLRPS